MLPMFKNRKITLEELGLFLAILLKHLRLMVLVVCAVVALALLYAVYARPVYYARSLVVVRYTPRVMDTQSLYGDSLVRHFKSALESPLIVERTAKRLGVDSLAKYITRNDIRKLKVYVNDTGNIEIEVWPIKFEWAEKWAQYSVEEYLKYRDEKRREEREYTIESQTRDLARLRDRMEEYVEESRDFVKQSQLSQAALELEEVNHVPARLQTVVDRLAELKRIREKLDNDEWDVVARLAYLSRLPVSTAALVGRVIPGPQGSGLPAVSEMTPDMGRPPGTVTAMGAAGSAVVVPSMVESRQPWEELVQNREAISAQLEEIRGTFLPGHPRYQAASSALERIDVALQAELDAAVRRLEIEYRDLVAERAELQAMMPVYEERVASYQRIRREVERFNLGRLNLTKTYEEVAKNLEKWDFGGQSEHLHIEYMGHLQLRTKPVSPNRFKLAVYGILAGLAAAVGFAFLLEYLNHTVSLIEQAEESLGISGLGVIPQMGAANTPSSKVGGALENKGHSQREVFRVIRTNILLGQGLPEKRQVIVVTSAVPKEGKSLVACNLAMSFAQLGDKTLLIDADMHRGKQHRAFGMESTPGLGSVLSGEVPLSTACRPTPYPNLDILPKDRMQGHIAEMITGPAYVKMLSTLRQQYDRIIVDTPPVLGLAETPVLTRAADGVVFVLWSAKTPFSQIKTAVKILSVNGANFLGCVVNRLDLGAATNYYYYYYYSDYYYRSYHQLPDSADAASEA